MKPIIPFTLRALVMAGLCTLNVMAGGDGLDITSSVIAGGGQVSRSADHRFGLAGTIGQAGGSSILGSTDGRFALQPGFWHGITVVPSPESPTLTLRRGVPGNMILAWPKSAAGFVLEERSDLLGGSWKAVLVRMVDTDTEHTVTVTNNGMRYFRLRKL